MDPIVEKIYQQVQLLPPTNMLEVLRFIEFLQFKQQQTYSETDYILNNPHLMQQIQAAEQKPEWWFMPSDEQLDLDKD
ncbi:hypothetical protein TI05_02720 [Achromatium sp. WMS3]|nr:hypothetical protein TI05_02720 [Achromatium sp. WMS3]